MTNLRDSLALLGLDNIPQGIKQDLVKLTADNPGLAKQVTTDQTAITPEYGKKTTLKEATATLKRATEAVNKPIHSTIPLSSQAKKEIKAHPAVEVPKLLKTAAGELDPSKLEVVMPSDQNGQTIYKIKGTNHYLNIPDDKLNATEVKPKGVGVLNIVKDKGYPDPVSNTQQDYAAKFTTLRDNIYEQGLQNDPLMQQLVQLKANADNFIGRDPQAAIDSLQLAKDIAGRKASIYALAENQANSDPAVKAALEAHNNALLAQRKMASKGEVNSRQKADANYLLTNTDLPAAAITHMVSGANAQEVNKVVDNILAGNVPPVINNYVGASGAVVNGYYRKQAIAEGTPKEEAVRQTNIVTSVRDEIIAKFTAGQLPNPEDKSSMVTDKAMLPSIIQHAVQSKLAVNLLDKGLHEAGYKSLSNYKSFMEGKGLDYHTMQTNVGSLLTEIFAKANVIDKGAGLTPDYLAEEKKKALIKLGLYGSEGLF